MEVATPHIAEALQRERPTTPGGHLMNAHGFHNAFSPTFHKRYLAATEKLPLNEQYGYANSWYAEMKKHDRIDE